MGMLYSQYSNPLELMNIYINQGRFGEFVSGFIDAEAERKKAEAKKDEDNKLWIAYLMSRSEKTFEQWKNDVIKSSENRNRKHGGGDESLDDEQIVSILDDLFPKETKDSPKRGEKS